MNSRQKGKRGERQWRDELRANGYDARRGQQFCGSPDSPDVICDALPWLHCEVKCVERLNIEDAMAQSRRDAGVKVPIVAHKRNFRSWLVTMDAETFFRLVRGDFAHEPNAEILKAEKPKSEVFGESPNTAGETPALPKSFPAAACAVATSENNKPKQKHEDPS
jgi:hypothetical protein